MSSSLAPSGPSRTPAVSWVWALSLALGACSGPPPAPAGGPSTSAASSDSAAPEEPSAEPAVPGSEGGPVVSRCALQVEVAGEWSDRAELACPGPSVSLLVMGDVGFAGPVLDRSVAGAKALCAERGCDVMLLAGDLIYGPGAEAEAHWAAVWDGALAQLKLPTMAVLGNHEWRHEPEPEKKRAAVLASDGRAGLVAPSPSFAARIVRGGDTLLAIAALDTDSVANPGPGMPGLGASALDVVCGLGVPVVALGHHPLTSQGLHHSHEAEVEAKLRAALAARRTAGCDIRVAVAGHDHNQQAYPPGCEGPDVPAVVVSGVAARGFRKAGPPHLPACGPGPSEGVATAYFAGREADGGYAHLEVALGPGESAVRLYATPPEGPPVLLATTPL